MKKIKAISSVYAYFYPEVREVVEKELHKFSRDILLKSIFPGLDDYHLPLIEKFIKYSSKYQKGLEGFTSKYFVNGSSEAIFHLLVDSINNNSGKPIYVFKGEYEGYREYTKNIGGSVIEVDLNADISTLPLGRWFISNPSSRDGNLIENDFINKICDLGHEVVLDIAYIGTTREYQIDTTNKNIIAVVASMSKPFGLFYYRIGFAFTRKPMPTLYANKWFKNILSINIGEAVLDKFGIGNFYKKYKSTQEKAVQKLSREIGQSVIPADIVLLAHLPINSAQDKQELLSKYQRGQGYRFCLTPYFLDLEK